MEVAFGITGAGKPFNCASAIKNWFDSTMKAGFACAWMIHAVIRELHSREFAVMQMRPG